MPLLEALVDDRVLPVVGSGFSRNAMLPTGRQMPLWSDLGDALEPEATSLSTDADPIESLSAYAEEHGRPALVARLRRALHDGVVRPGRAHRAFARLPFSVIVTTNFDSLLEDACGSVHRSARVLVREDHLASQVPRRALSIVKAHGDFDNEPVLIATENDYDEFLLRRPLLATHLASLLLTRVALLIGYSLTDSNWRQLFAALRTRLGRSQQTIYALAIDASEGDVKRFSRRGVKVINLESNGRPYEEVLFGVLEEMHEYVAVHALDDSVVRDEGALEEFHISAPEDRRLCLFLIPERMLGYYRENVFPALRDEAGVQAITAYDFDAPGASIEAKIIGLIESARAIVVDLSDEATSVWFEAGLVAQSAEGRRVAAVVDPARQGIRPSLPGGFADVYLFRESALDPKLPDALANWALEVFGPKRRPPEGRFAAYARSMPEPGLMVIQAFRELEFVLGTRYGGHGRFSAQLQRAVGDGVIGRELARPLRRGYGIRSEVLHRGYEPTQAEADAIVRSVEVAIRRVDEA